ELDMPPDLPPVFADEERLQQILVNLIGNAVKFTHEGRVVVRGRRMDDAVRLEVEDTGIGIPVEARERIFLSFEQADGSTAREYGGMGLGLAIVRSLVELHGSKVELKSEPGRGSVFAFGLPIATDAAEAPRASARTNSILVDAAT